jgi:hypothetical protein
MILVSSLLAAPVEQHMAQALRRPSAGLPAFWSAPMQSCARKMKTAAVVETNLPQELKVR